MVVRESRHQRRAGALAVTAILALLAASAARAFDVPKKVELPPRLRQALEKLDTEKYRIVAEPLEYSYGESARLISRAGRYSRSAAASGAWRSTAEPGHRS